MSLAASTERGRVPAAVDPESPFSTRQSFAPRQRRRIASPTSREVALRLQHGLYSAEAMMVKEFDTVGLGQWFRYFTGILELVGGVAILVPSVSVFGAILLLFVDTGAFIAQVAVLHMDWVHTIVVAAILGAVINLQRGRLGF